MAAVGFGHIAAIRKRQKLVTLLSAFQANPKGELGNHLASRVMVTLRGAIFDAGRRYQAIAVTG
jgi:hypothetical protein